MSAETDARVEFLLGGGWVEVTDDVRVDAGITIERPRKSEQEGLGPSTCAMTLDNGAEATRGVGWASPRNPLSPFYGLLVRNVECRVSVPYGAQYLRMPGGASDFLSAPDTAGLSVTGDIDVRIDVTLDNWYGSTALVNKYSTSGNQRSWSLDVNNDGVVTFTWSPDGTFSARKTATATITPGLHDRVAIRVTLDVNNGSGGYTCSFYTSDSIDGSWTLVGSTVTTSGTTSICDSTAAVTIGTSLSGFGTSNLRGKLHACQIYSGIGGTLVAGLDARSGLFGAPYLVGTPVAQASGVSATVTLTVTTPVPAGHKVRAVLGSSGGTTVNSFADSKGNTYSLARSAIGGTPRTHLYEVTVTTALAAGDTITATMSSAANAYNLIVAASSGVLAVDVSNDASGTSTSPSVTSPALAAAYELAVAAISNGNGGGAPSWAAGWTVLSTQHTGSTHWTSSAYRTTSTTAAVSASATIVSAAWTALVATFTPQTSAIGMAGPFLDAASNVWTLSGDVAIDDRDYRFWGELSDLPPKWDLSGRDATVPVKAFGRLCRLQQGDTPLRSAMYREHTNPARTGIVAYWSLEDEAGATVIASGLSDKPGMTITGTPTLAGNSEWTASDPLPVMANGRLAGRIAPYTATGEISARMFVFVDQAVASETGLLMLTTTGTARIWEVRVDASGNLRTRAWAEDGTSLLDSFVAFGVNSIGFFILALELTQTGSDVFWRTKVLDFVNTASVRDTIPGSSVSGTVVGQTIGRATVAVIGRNQGLTSVVCGHLAVGDDIAAFTDTLSAIAAWNGERPSTRMARLCAEEDIDEVEVNGGETANTVTMGDQMPGKLIDLLTQCEDTDGGVVYEPRDRVGIAYRTRTSFYNQAAALTVSCGNEELAASLDPVDDDTYIRNDVTVGREDGSKYRAEKTTGPLNVNDPADDPDGAGRYVTSPTISLERDDQLPDQAGWLLHLGTTDEARYPTIELMLHEVPFATDADMRRRALALDIGDRVVVTDPPAGLPPDDISQLLVGYTETIGQFEHFLSLNCRPESPWQVGALYDTAKRIDTEGSQTTAAFNAGTDTSMTVASTSGPIWVTTAVDAAQFPFNIRVAGVELQVTGITAAVADAFGRTVANGWSTPDIGPAYATSGGAAGDYAVAAGVGTHTITAAASGRWTTLTSPSADIDLYGSLGTGALATGASQFVYLVGRFLDTSNCYLARLEFTTGAAVILSLRKLVAGVETQLAAITTPLTHVAGTLYRVRLQASGSTLAAKAWLPANGPEPSIWHITTTDTDLTATGGIGCRSFRATGNTNTNLVASFDDFALVNPQTFTVTQAPVNGVTKTIPAGEAVNVADPFVLAM